MAELDEKYNFRKQRESRASGILMHISSLPGAYGIGTLGKAAYGFVDFLHDAGQKLWQVLPVGQTGYGDSPYQSFSTYAGNPYFIDLDILVEEGLFDRAEISRLDENIDTTCVDFGRLYSERYPVLRKAFARFDLNDEKYLKFCDETFWLEDYALFMAIKNIENVSRDNFPEKLKRREKDELKKYISEHREEVNFYKFLQFKFFEQWSALKRYANEKGIKIIGDLPIYVAGDSADVWANPELFQLDEELSLKFVGGCPPDAFTDDGQLWGNPLYDWKEHEAEGYEWWIRRIKGALSLFDVVRIDHFRGFESYWSIPAGDENARRGHWEQGPAMKLFDAVKAVLPDASIIAEDLGYMTEEVYRFREASGFPGMKILQFAFNPAADSDYLPHNITENSVVYTGTHDNDTICGWLYSVNEEEKDFARRYLGLSHEESYHWGIMRGAMTTIAQTCILQMQDLLGFDNSARMNCPGTASGNWVWRMNEGSTSPELAAKLRELTRISGRL